MTLPGLRNWFVFGVSSVVLAGSALAAPPIKNVVLVHSAFVDGSGWQPVYDILVKDGYSVTVVQDPLTSLEEDVAATKRVLDRQPGQVVLVGHSYGGAVITEAGTDSHVAALVYIAAHAPEEGETEAANGKKFPNSSKPLIKTPDGFVFLDPANFPADFAADLPREQAEFMAHSQMPTAAKVFNTPIANPAWKLKRAGIWWQKRIKPSTPTWNVCTPSVRIATR
jgi:pimeloyl-ACP methyl ester carboxylesterase